MAAEVVPLLLALILPVTALLRGQLATTLHLRDSGEDVSAGHHVMARPEWESEDRAARVRRDVTPSSAQNITHLFSLNDTHYQMIIHWAGQNSDVVVALTRDIHMTVNSTSSVYISQDYGSTFHEKKLLLSNGEAANIDKFYNSLVTNSHYIFADVEHNVLFYTHNYARDIVHVHVPFSPKQILFYPTRSNMALGYDPDDSQGRLWVTHNLGARWIVLTENVKSFTWGVQPYDADGVLYVERLRTVEKFTGVTSNEGIHRTRLESNVEDFQLQDNYMFVSKRSSIGGGLQFYVSHNRGIFQEAQFPFDDVQKDYYVSDASEDQVFLCVFHNVTTTHLYVSGVNGTRFSLSLKDIVYYNPDHHNNTMFRYLTKKPFADLYRIEGLRGIYVASQFIPNNSSEAMFRAVSNQRSLITFDKGGTWNPIPAPAMDSNGTLTACHLHRFIWHWGSRATYQRCSLHLAQQYHTYHPDALAFPILSKKSAVGLILASGTLGTNFSSKFDVFLSTNGGVEWKEVLKGPHNYAFGDHGGIMVAVKAGELTGELLYSYNEGQTWQAYEFSHTKMWIYGVLTEPGEKTTIFSLFGTYRGRHQWEVIKVDLKSILGQPCTKDDYKDWSPSDHYKVHCLMGRRLVYKRRRAHSLCYNGANYDRPVHTDRCPCTLLSDYECDLGYEKRSLFSSSCVRESNSTYNPYQIPVPCPEGSYYTRTRGYRRVSGDTCAGGQEHRYEPDRVSCPENRQEEFLLYTTRHAVYKLLLLNGRTEQLPLTGLRNVLAVEYDYKENCVYWADSSADNIQRLCLGRESDRRQEVVVHESVDNIEGLALDWMSGMLYWVDAGDSSHSKIEMARTDGSHRRLLINHTHLDKPRAIVLYPKHGYMYWTDWSDSNPRIMSAWMDGTHIKAIVRGSNRLRWPNGLAVDEERQRLYWTDASYDSISSVDFHGNNFHQLLRRSPFLPHPYAIAVYKGELYWTDWRLRAIVVADKNTGAGAHIYKGNLTDIMDLKVLDFTSQQGASPCSNAQRGGCSSICVERPHNTTYPLPLNRTCLCSDEFNRTALSGGGETCLCEAGEAIINGSCMATGRNSTCAPHQFLCGNGRCVPYTWKCDSDNDCGDSSDEEGCVYNTCLVTQFSCSNSHCIPHTWKCDHDNDCGDGSDELNCEYASCQSSEFTCGTNSSGRCIPQRWVCDGDDDCHDMSDEQNCTGNATQVPSCTSHQFACRTGACIDARWKCDGENDCTDGSDERGCNTTAPVCDLVWQRACETGRCISRYRWCDGHTDCADGSDEANCHRTRPSTRSPTTPGHTCSYTEYPCAHGGCIQRSEVCDGIDDCLGGDDERDCGAMGTTLQPGCAAGWRCANRVQCVTTHQRCDGRRDCNDGSDEVHCSGTQNPCRQNFFHCDNGRCIPSSYLCDGDKDCSSGEDEHACNNVTEVCLPSEFQCESGGKVCIQRTWVCDGDRDCYDGSDELNCQVTGEVEYHCGFSQFDCRDGECVALGQVCDGKLDCRSGADENATICNSELPFDVSLLNSTAAAFRWDSQDVPLSPLIIFIGRLTPDKKYKWEKRVPVAVSVTYTEVGGLQPYTQYVCALVEKGKQPVTVQQFMTGNEAPAKPQNVTVKVLPGPGFHAQLGLQVAWMVPTAFHSKVLRSFTVRWQRDGSSVIDEHKIIVGASDVARGRFSTTLTDLEEFAFYNITVFATNDAGRGRPATKRVQVVLAGYPGCTIVDQITQLVEGDMIVMLSNNDSTRPALIHDGIMVHWNYLGNATKDHIKSYLVYAVSQATLDVQVITVDASKSYSYTKLKLRSPGVQYVVGVQAVNQDGRKGRFCEKWHQQYISTTGPPMAPPKTSVILSQNDAGGDVLNIHIRSTTKSEYLLLYSKKRHFISSLAASNQDIDPFLTENGYVFTNGVCNATFTTDVYALGGLDACTSYGIAVYQRETGDKGVTYSLPYTTWMELPPSPYTAPTQVSVQIMNHTQKDANVNITWRMPCNDIPQYIMANYYVNVTEVHDDGQRGLTNLFRVSNFNLTQSTGNWVWRKVQGLHRGATYRVMVKTWYYKQSQYSQPITLAVAPYPAPRSLQVRPTYESTGAFYEVLWEAPVSLPNTTFVYGVHHAEGNGSFSLMKQIPSTRTRTLVTNLDPVQIHRFRVRMENIYSYPGLFSVEEYVTSPSPEKLALIDSTPPAPTSDTNSSLLTEIVVPVVALAVVLIIVLIVLVARHRRLHRSFLQFANSHYDTRSGRTSFGGTDLDEDDQPMIQGFSDDEPLIIA